MDGVWSIDLLYIYTLGNQGKAKNDNFKCRKIYLAQRRMVVIALFAAGAVWPVRAAYLEKLVFDSPGTYSVPFSFPKFITIVFILR